MFVTIIITAMTNKIHPDYNNSRLDAIVSPYYEMDAYGQPIEKPTPLFNPHLPSNKQLIEEVISSCDTLLATGKVGATAMAQMLKVKLDAVTTLSQSKELELAACLRQACALLNSLIAESEGRISPNTANLVTRFVMELNLLDGIKPL
jgi:hypothetical protein